MRITTISNVSLENNLKIKCSIQHLLNLITMPKREVRKPYNPIISVVATNLYRYD